MSFRLPFFKKPIHDVVHLGNIGADLGARTHADALANKDKKYFGIDLNEAPQNRPENWQQHVGDFVNGLRKLKDNSVKEMSSVLAVGHYGPKVDSPISLKYTARVLQFAYNKLAPQGRFEIIVGGLSRVEQLRQALSFTKFKIIDTRQITEQESRETWYLKRFYDNPEKYTINRGSLVRIVLEK
jgi:hypothetical protein